MKTTETQPLKQELESLTQEVYKEGYHTGVLLDICGAYSGLSVKVAKEQMKQVDIRRHKFHPEWNYSIYPNKEVILG